MVDFFINNPIAAIALGSFILLPGMLFLFSKHYGVEYKAKLQHLALHGLNNPSGKKLIGFNHRSRPFNYLLVKLFGVNGAFGITKFLFAPLALILGVAFIIRGLYLIINNFL